MFEPGRNCWRITHADRAAVLIDAADYYRVIREAMLNARQRILIISWDFDPRILLDRTAPHNRETLGDFLLGLAKARPTLEIKILKWDLGALKLLGRGLAWVWVLRWKLTRAIQFRLDSAHPTGCSHHQKIVVIDDVFAICGGIDMTSDRWDTPAHRDDEPGRTRPNGTHYSPWHDVTMAVDGAAAAAIGELARERWHQATGRKLAPCAARQQVWPATLPPTFETVDLAIARTRANHGELSEIKEIEALFLDMILRAKRFIYIENQYFTSPKLAGAIAQRMQEDDPPEIVLIGPLQADGWLEQIAMDTARARLVAAIGRGDRLGRFRVYVPHTAGGQPIYVHAKLMIVDDVVCRVGSANMNNRSLGLDSECDLTLDGDHGPQIEALRVRLMAEHLGVDEDVVRVQFASTGSLVTTIESLRGAGKTLVPLDVSRAGGIEAAIADLELLDPASPSAMFEGLTKPSLWARFRRAARRARRARRYSGRKSGTDK